MAQKMLVEVISPSRQITKVTAGRVSVPSRMGYLTILPDHAALIAELDIGHVQVSDVDGEKDVNVFVSGGYLQVADNRVTILADVVEKKQEINRSRAEKALARAQERLLKTDVDLDYQRANRALFRAQQRLIFLDILSGEETTRLAH